MARFCSVLMFAASLVFPIQASYFGSWQFVPQYIVPIQSFLQTPPDSLELTGPDELFENASAQFRAIVHFPDGSTQDISATASWGITPSVVGTIQSGLLSAGDLDQTMRATVWARYQTDGIDLQAQKGITILAICRAGYALRFDGLDDLVIVPRSQSLEPSEITVELWANLEGEQLYHTRMLRKCAGFSNGYILAANHHMNRTIQAIFPLWNTAGGDIIATDTQSYSAYFGTWHHFAGVYSSQFIAFYVDGVQIKNIPHSHGIMRHSVSDLIIGNGIESYLEAFKGLIDEVRVWNMARTESQIRESMNRNLVGTEQGLVGYWNFDEGQGQVVHDLSSFANHGFLGAQSQDSDAADPVWVLSDAPVGICDERSPSGKTPTMWTPSMETTTTTV